MDDRVGSRDWVSQRRGIAEIGLDRTDVAGALPVLGQRPAMVHQPQLMPGGHEVAGKEAPQVPGSTRYQNRASVLHRCSVRKRVEGIGRESTASVSWQPV